MLQHYGVDLWHGWKYSVSCVSSCLSNSSAVGPGGGFRALANGVSSLSCTVGSADAGIPCLFSSIEGLPAICSTCSTGWSRLSAIIRCTCSESALGRSIQNVRFSRFSSILPAGFNGVSSQTQAPCGENTTVILLRSLRTQPQPALRHK